LRPVNSTGANQFLKTLLFAGASDFTFQFASLLIFSREIRPWRAIAFGDGGPEKTVKFSAFCQVTTSCQSSTCIIRNYLQLTIVRLPPALKLRWTRRRTSRRRRKPAPVTAEAFPWRSRDGIFTRNTVTTFFVRAATKITTFFSLDQFGASAISGSIPPSAEGLSREQTLPRLFPLALIDLVCRPSPKKPAHQGDRWKDSPEGATSSPLMKAGW
jgi:hypothetical protein